MEECEGAWTTHAVSLAPAFFVEGRAFRADVAKLELAIMETIRPDPTGR